MKLKYLYIGLLSALIYSCDDATTGIGDSTIAAGDSISAGVSVYDVYTQIGRASCRERVSSPV